jgi:hypothetical protein
VAAEEEDVVRHGDCCCSGTGFLYVMGVFG